MTVLPIRYSLPWSEKDRGLIGNNTNTPFFLEKKRTNRTMRRELDTSDYRSFFRTGNRREYKEGDLGVEIKEIQK